MSDLDNRPFDNCRPKGLKLLRPVEIGKSWSVVCEFDTEEEARIFFDKCPMKVR